MKDKILIIVFVIILFSFSLTIILSESQEVSKYERRKLTTSNDLKENFTENLDDFLSDQFPLRDTLISLSSLYEREILNIKDSKNAYIYNNDYIIEKNYPLNTSSVSNYIKKINYINDTYLINNKVYHSVIPDKAFFLDGDYLKLDYDYLLDTVKKGVLAEYIDLSNFLRLEDYYKTDIHIKQPSYLKIVKELSRFLNFNYEDYKYQIQSYNTFLGSSYSKAPMYKNYDSLEWMTSDYMKNVKVKHLEFKDSSSIYEVDELESMDSYNIFLKGPSSLIEIENFESQNDKELVIFRDSFASSLTPLLIPYYKKIILIDLRYIRMDLVSNYVNFKDKDILFLYSTLIINSSDLLKVNNFKNNKR